MNPKFNMNITLVYIISGMKEDPRKAPGNSPALPRTSLSDEGTTPQVSHHSVQVAPS